MYGRHLGRQTKGIKSNRGPTKGRQVSETKKKLYFSNILNYQRDGSVLSWQTPKPKKNQRNKPWTLLEVSLWLQPLRRKPSILFATVPGQQGRREWCCKNTSRQLLYIRSREFNCSYVVWQLWPCVLYKIQSMSHLNSFVDICARPRRDVRRTDKDGLANAST